MHPVLRNIIGFVVGLLSGMVLNMGIIEIGGKLVPLPEGVNPANMEEYNQSIHLLGLEHFAVVFLAHALGTLVGAFLAAKIAASHQMKFAIVIGVLFLLGGSYMVYILPNAPIWFSAADLLLAYIPMAYFGGKLAVK